MFISIRYSEKNLIFTITLGGSLSPILQMGEVHSITELYIFGP